MSKTRTELATVSPPTAELSRAVVIIRHKTDLKKFVRNHDNAAPLDLVNAINITLQLAIYADNEAHHRRLDAGRLLLALRQKVEAESEDWWQWQKGKFDRSRKDIEKLMRLASADDPEAVIEDERAKHKIRNDRRPRIGALSAPTVDTKRKLVSEPAAGSLPLSRQVNLMVNELDEFLSRWCEVTGSWIKEHQQELEQEEGGATGMTGKSCLTQFMHTGADRLLRLAQALDGR